MLTNAKWYLNPWNILLHALFILLFLTALLFYKERIFSDTGYYLFHLINTESFHLEHDRLVLILSQLLPFIGVKAGLSLNTILVLYSLGHVFFFYGLFLYCLHVLHNSAASVLLILLQTLGLLDGYFAPGFEMYYGIALLVLFQAMLMHQWPSKSFLRILFLLLTEVIILTSHPLCFLLFMYVLLFDFLWDDKNRLKKYLIFVIIMMLCLAYKSTHLSEYETGKVGYHLNFIENKNYLHLFSAGYLKTLANYLYTYYKEPFLLLSCALIFSLVKRRYRSVLLSLFSVAGFIALLNMTSYGLEHTRYQEQVYFPIVFLCTVPLYDLFRKPGFRWNVALYLLVFLMVCYRMWLIHDTGKKFSARVSLIERLINHSHSLHISKAVIHQPNIESDFSGISWSLPIESMLLSAAEGEGKAVSIATNYDMEFNDNLQRLTDNEVLLRRWDIVNQHSLHQTYFRLRNGSYKELNNSKPGTEQQAGKLYLKVLKNDIYMIGNDHYLDIVLLNTGTNPVFSHIANELYLTYSITKNNRPYAADKVKTPIETDIYKSYIQPLRIKLPAEDGQYQLVFYAEEKGAPATSSAGMPRVNLTIKGHKPVSP